MLRKALLSAALLAAGSIVALAQPRPDDSFGVLRTPGAAPQAPAPARPTVLPPGVEPASRPSSLPNPYPITPAVGSWVICAAHYSGADGMELAIQVARILREKHRLPAYIFNHADEERRRLDAEWAAMKKRYPDAVLRYRHVPARSDEQFAVLVGGYRDFEAASAGLKAIRNLPMPELRLQSGRVPYEYLHYTEPTPDMKGMIVKKSPVNPFTQALVVRNPTANATQEKPKWDPFWKQLNADEEYSLLRNPKKYTLVVKQYAGASVIQSNTSTPTAEKTEGGGLLGLVGLGSKAVSPLEASAAQAHELAKFLRTPQLGFESYVLHTRTGSAVTVGAFDGPDDPSLNSVLRRLNNLQFNGGVQGADPVGLMRVPQMIEVPRF